MIFLKSGQHKHNEQHAFELFSGSLTGSWLEPAGTHYLLGKNLEVELSGGARFQSATFSALSLNRAYRVLAGENGIRLGVPYFRGLNQWTELEASSPGRLRYIDGCSNTNVIAPLRDGDPCVNYLFIPPGTKQSAHVHPSARVGIICGGRGAAHCWDGDQLTKIPLSEGMMFLLPSQEKHCFHTEDSSLSVLVFHPDSEGGPLDETNPMFTRTYLR